MEDTFLTDFVLTNKSNFVVEKPQSIFKDSPLEFIIQMPSPHDRGNFVTKLLMFLSAWYGIPTARNGWILNIRGHPVAVKFSRQGEDGGFVINQIRDQEYEYIVAVVVLPDPLVTIFTIPKDYIMSITKGQHGGAKSTETHIYTANNIDEMRKSFPNMEGVEVFCETFSK